MDSKTNCVRNGSKAPGDQGPDNNEYDGNTFLWAATILTMVALEQRPTLLELVVKTLICFLCFFWLIHGQGGNLRYHIDKKNFQVKKKFVSCHTDLFAQPAFTRL